MKKGLFAIIIAGLFIATVFSTISASASIAEVKDEIEPLGMDTGDIGVFVFNERPRLFSSLPRIIPITDATVTLIDSSGGTHEMVYELVEPEHDFYAYMARDVPAGPCEITATKSGYDSGTINENVHPGGDEIYKLKMEKNPLARSFPTGLLDILIDAFPILRVLLRL